MEKYNVIEHERKDVYIYGVELILSTIAGLLALIIVSACNGQFFQWFPYLLGFIPLRLFGGGYHAKSHMHCIITFTSTYLICITFINFHTGIKFLVVGLSIIIFFVILHFSPVEARNKKLSKSLHARNRRKSIVLGIVDMAILVIYIDIPVNYVPWITEYLFGYISAGFFILLATLKKYEEKI